MGTAFYQHPLTSIKEGKKRHGSQIMIWSLEHRWVIQRESWKGCYYLFGMVESISEEKLLP